METDVNWYLNQIIDELHPDFKPISDEELVEDFPAMGRFERSFLHTNGKKFRMSWWVYYGSPKTVRTLFEKAIVI